MVSSVCSEFISRAKDYPITYNRRLFNHLPMMLIALDEMGATPAQLKSSYECYVERFALLESTTDPANPIKQQFTLFQQQYFEQLNDQGIEVTVKSALIDLMPGVAAGVFYALTRLATALKSNDLEEIATALACWHLHYLDIAGIKPLVDKKPRSLLRTTAKVVNHYRFPPGNTVDRMISVLALDQYHQIPSQPQEINFALVVNTVLSAYKMTGDFTMHHCVVAVKSFGQLREYFGDQEQALRYFWQAVVVAYLSTGGVPMVPVVAVDLIDWTQIKQFCCDCTNEHLIEICHACEQLFHQTNDPNCHIIASRLVHYNR